MAIKFNRSQTFATNGTVTAAALHNLIDGTDIYQALITDQTAMTSVGSLDKLLIADSDLTAGDAPRSVTVNELFEDALTLSTYTNIKATNATITTGTIATLNSTTGTIPTLTSITKITSGTGTAAAPAISPTGDTNTGIFFPDADTVAFAEGGTEAMRIDSAGDVGIGTTNPVYKLDVSGLIASQSNQAGIVFSKTNNAANNKTIQNTIDGSGNMVWQAINDAGAGGGNSFSLIRSAQQINSIEAQSSGTTWFKIDNSATNVGIGTTSPAGKLDVYDATSSILNVLGNSTVQAVVYKGSSDTAAPILILRKSRGSVESPTAVATGDQIGNINFQAFGGTNNRGVCRIISNVEAYVSDSDISSNLTFLTSAAGGVTATERLRIGPSGQIGIGGATYGTSGQVLTSGGSAAAPSWSNVTIGTNSVTFPTLSTSTTQADNVASRVARAWVNWNGTGTVATRASFNVSSITDHATGKYGVNFTVAMSDANYAVLFSGGFDPGAEARIFNNIDSDNAQTTSAVRVNSINATGTQIDTDRASVVVFR